MVDQTEIDVLLRDSASSVEAWFEEKNLIPSGDAATTFLEMQSWTSAVDFAKEAEPLIHYCVNVVTNLVPMDKDAVSDLLHLELGPVCMSGWIGARSSREADVVVGLIAKVRRWLQDYRHSQPLVRDVEIRAIEPPQVITHVQIRSQALWYLTMASFDLHASEKRNHSYHSKLAWIRSTLSISSAELSRLLHVSREAVRKWDLNEPISSERWADIDQLYSDVEKLLTYIRPENLPAVIRRRIPAFNNQTPLELLAGRRSSDLLSLYEGLTSYETTA